MSTKKRKKRIRNTRVRRSSTTRSDESRARLSGRDLVRAALAAAQAVVGEQLPDRVTLPTWVIVSSLGAELERNALFLDGPVADDAVVETITQRARKPGATAVALVRVDDSDLRILAWNLAGGARAVSRPVIEAGRIKDWRLGWVDEFDSTLRGTEGPTLAYLHVDQTSQEEAAAQLEDLANQTLKFFIEQVLPGTVSTDDVADTRGGYGDHGRVVISRTQLQVEGGAGLGHLLNQIRQEVVEAEKPSAVYILNWPRSQRLDGDERRFMIVGCDRRYDSVFASEIVALALGAQLSFDSIESIPLARLEQLLDEAERDSGDA